MKEKHLYIIAIISLIVIVSTMVIVAKPVKYTADYDKIFVVSICDEAGYFLEKVGIFSFKVLKGNSMVELLMRDGTKRLVPSNRLVIVEVECGEEWN